MQPGNMRGKKYFIIRLEMLIPPEVLYCLSDYCSIRVPENQSGSEFFAELTMVTFFDLFKIIKVCLEFLLCIKSGTVYPLQHFVLFVAAPVSPRNTQKFEGLHPAGPGRMRPPAQVHEPAFFIQRH